MPWYIRTGTTSGATAYDMADAAIRQARATLKLQEQRGYRVTDEGGRKVIRDGHDLINTMWVEDEDGKVVPFPYP
jgi:hypothetical protein